MKNLKKVIIILLILVAIISIVILILKKQEGESDMKEVNSSQDYINEMDRVSSNITFFSVEKMLNNYIMKAKIENSDAVYSLLDSKYIKQNNITKENVLEKTPENVKTANNIRIRQMYSQTNLENEVYYIDCMLEADGQGDESYFIVYNDRQNETYSVEQITMETFEREIKYTNEELENKSIEKNEYNHILSLYPSEQEIVDKMFYDFIGNAVYYPEYAYSLLDEDYRDKRFPTIQDFKEYIESRNDLYSGAVAKKTYDDFDSMDEYVLYISNKQKLQLQSYQIRYEDDCTRYIVMDNYNNYFIFSTTAPLTYTVKMDTYTIDMKEFIEKYEAGTKEEKVGYNIQKIVEALNCNDYKYVYEKLADEFKENYFKTYEDFEEYAKEKFEIKNTVTFNKYTESENISTYEITIQGKTKTITKTIVMQLGEEMDFVISFNVE